MAADIGFNSAALAQQQMYMQQLQIQNAINNQRQMQQAMMMQQRNAMYGALDNGNGFNGPAYTDNFSSAYTGGTHLAWRDNPLFGGSYQREFTQGYGIDNNRNGFFDRGRDGVLVFDTNHDGKFDAKDVQKTRSMMLSVTQDVDLNNDGFIDASERAQSQAMRANYRKVDLDGDGVLSTAEIANAGGKVWIDSSQNGKVNKHELHSPYSMPNPNGFGPTQRLDAVDPFSRLSATSNNWGWSQPSPFDPCGLGYPGSSGYGGGGYSGGYSYGSGYGYGRDYGFGGGPLDIDGLSPVYRGGHISCGGDIHRVSINGG